MDYGQMADGGLLTSAVPFGPFVVAGEYLLRQTSRLGIACVCIGLRVMKRRFL